MKLVGKSCALWQVCWYMVAMTTGLRKLTTDWSHFLLQSFYSYILRNEFVPFWVLVPRSYWRNVMLISFKGPKVQLCPRSLTGLLFSRTSLIIFTTKQPRRSHCRKCWNSSRLFFIIWYVSYRSSWHSFDFRGLFILTTIIPNFSYQL